MADVNHPGNATQRLFPQETNALHHFPASQDEDRLVHLWRGGQNTGVPRLRYAPLGMTLSISTGLLGMKLRCSPTRTE